MNIKECKDEALSLLNRLSIAGTTVPLSYGNQADYTMRMIGLINDAMSTIATTTKKILAQYVILQVTLPNLLSDSCMNTFTHLDKDEIYEAARPAKAYSFDVGAASTVYIEHLIDGAWLPVLTITGSADTNGSYKNYKGRVSCAGPSRIRFAGAYTYGYRYPCLYEYDFASDAAVPAYSPWVAYEMPADFFQLNGRGISQYRGSEFVLGHDYEWRGKTTLLLRRGMDGEFGVEYYRNPVKVTATTPELTELDNSVETHQAIPFYVASFLVQQDNPNLAATLYNTFETKLIRFGERIQTDVTEIVDVYGLMGGGM